MQNYTTSQNAALFALRLAVAAIFIVAGYMKLPFWSGLAEGLPVWLIYVMRLLSIAEPLGAIAVLSGFLSRLAAAGLAVIMVGAIFISHFMMHIGFTTSAGAGWNFPLMVLAGCLVLAAFGPGTWAIKKKFAASADKF